MTLTPEGAEPVSEILQHPALPFVTVQGDMLAVIPAPDLRRARRVCAGYGLRGQRRPAPAGAAGRGAPGGGAAAQPPELWITRWGVTRTVMRCSPGWR
ncbi:hypothetical protein Pta02_35040 [Planobispora takensis]|uniref:Uncharacterized protein n=1 Tax=Planobispora takensis TaxID=1367882 RepID=A0A8J3WTG5_9ACTN|nr:hypothetical protein Pta02_35040 [Planobispora takensis]